MSKVRKCRICGAILDDDANVLKIPCNQTGANGGVQWVCYQHGVRKSWHDTSVTDLAYAQFKDTNEHIRIAPELEFNYKTLPTVNGLTLYEEEINAYLSYLFNGEVTSDCTVDGELNVPPVRSLRGFRDRLGQALQVVDMNSFNCGAHINISCSNWTNDNFNVFDIQDIFTSMLDYLMNHTPETENIFGRTFNKYCKCDNEFGHYSWLNIRDCNESPYLEFRLPHVKTVEQYMTCLDLIKRWALTLNERLKLNLTRADTLKQMQKDFDKAAKSKLAVCNRSKIVGNDRTRNQHLIKK